jgi:hypothetical protein
MEAVIQDIIDRFTSHQRAAYTLGVLLPSRAQAETWQALKPSYDKYKDTIIRTVKEVSEEQARAEFMVWSATCRQQKLFTTSAIDAVNQCPVNTLPTIHTMLTILATLPVCTAEAERTFSKVERTLTALRSTMSEDRLDALIMLQAHREIIPDTKTIIDHFIGGADGRRRIDLSL